MERRGHRRQAQIAVRDLPGARRAAELAGGGQQQPVVGPDEQVATRRPHDDGPPRGPDTRIDDGHVDPDRQVADRPRQQEGAVADRELADVVR